MPEETIIERRRVVGSWREIVLVRMPDKTYVAEAHDEFGDYERIGWPFTGTFPQAYRRFESQHAAILAQYGVRAVETA